MADARAQLESPSYRLAVEDLDFLLRDEVRAVRFALEYQKAETLLRDWKVRSTIIVFGSARVHEGDHWYDQARRFARIVSERGGVRLTHEGDVRDNVIATGGGPGIMEAANRGAGDAGAPSIGFNINLPHEQEPNGYSTPALTFRFHYFAMRKMHLAMRARALAVFPGGFGTLDEMFEILTLQQTRKMQPAPVVLVGESYWRKVINFDALIEAGMAAREDLDLFQFAADADEAWAELARQGVAIDPDVAGG